MCQYASDALMAVCEGLCRMKIRMAVARLTAESDHSNSRLNNPTCNQCPLRQLDSSQAMHLKQQGSKPHAQGGLLQSEGSWLDQEGRKRRAQQ